MKYILHLFILTTFTFSLHAQNKGLDLSFGNDGMSFPDPIIFFYNDGSGSFSLQAIDKILVGGRGVRRYNSNGGSDNTFHEVVVPSGGYMKVQPDEKILVVANLWWQTNQYSVLTRLNADGTIDTAFGNNGNGVDTFFKSSLDIITAALLLQPDNKIILVASTTSDMVYLTRLLPNGLIDSSFGTNGVVMDFGPSNAYSYVANGAALQDDGKIVVGITESTSQYFYTAIRFLPSGERDTTYGDHGFARYPNLHRVNAVSIQSDGKILLAGTNFGVPQSDTAGVPFQLVRFDTAGHIDTSFNHTGLGLYTWGGGESNKCKAMVVQPDGKIILGGRAWNKIRQQYDFAVMRILPDGNIDNSFGESGQLRTQVGTGIDEIKNLLLQPDGKILALGSENDSIGRVLIRYLPNGETSIDEPSLNTSFMVYPNPATEKLHLLSKGSPAAVTITLTDITGRIMLTRTCTLGKQEIGLSNLKAGIYILNITDSNNKTERFKVVKQ